MFIGAKPIVMEILHDYITLSGNSFSQQVPQYWSPELGIGVQRVDLRLIQGKRFSPQNGMLYGSS